MNKPRSHPFNPRIKPLNPAQTSPTNSHSSVPPAPPAKASTENPTNTPPPAHEASNTSSSPSNQQETRPARAFAPRIASPPEAIGLTLAADRKFIVIDDQILNMDHILFVRRYPPTETTPPTVVIDFTPHFNRLNTETNVDEFKPHFLTVKGPVADDIWRFIIQHKAAAQFRTIPWRPTQNG